MKIALAQIDMRLGDIEGVCARIESQAILAHEQEADLLAVPVPLLAGILPGSLIEVEDFEHDMVSALSALAEPAGAHCLGSRQGAGCAGRRHVG